MDRSGLGEGMWISVYCSSTERVLAGALLYSAPTGTCICFT